MPYIPKRRRERYDCHIDDLIRRLNGLSNDELAGDLNYIFFRLSIMLSTSDVQKGISNASISSVPIDLGYARLATISGALSEAQAEFRRRIIAPYEDEKIQESGDVKV